MAKKARHAYGSRNDVISAIQDGRIDSYDVLFLSGEETLKTHKLVMEIYKIGKAGMRS